MNINATKLEPLVSVILPVYNRNEYLKQAINSVLSQSYKNWELVIADDASDNNTRDLLQEYVGLSKVKVKFNSKNLGLFSNLNEAMVSCQGEYIILLCSDDFLRPHCLETCLSLIYQYFEVSLILSTTDTIDSNSKLLCRSRSLKFVKETRILYPQETVPLLLQYGSINGNLTGIFFRKSLYEQVGSFREDWQHAADWEWLYRVADCSPILVSKTNVAAIRSHAKQLSGVNFVNQRKSIEVAEMTKTLLSNPRVSNLELAQYWALNIMEQCLWYAVKFAFQGRLLAAIINLRLVHETTGIASTFWTMLNNLPRRWKNYKKKSNFFY
jgi:glycosyltransferase involved in cell wall biosynthesis